MGPRTWRLCKRSVVRTSPRSRRWRPGSSATKRVTSRRTTGGRSEGTTASTRRYWTGVGALCLLVLRLQRPPAPRRCRRGVRRGGRDLGFQRLADLIREGEFEIVASRAFSNPRQRAQRGVFTRLTHRSHFDVANYLAERDCADRLVRWEIPASELDVALNDLRLANITPSTLFPDLGGAASEANSAYEQLFESASGSTS